jgi:hypothetical protein
MLHRVSLLVAIMVTAGLAAGVGAAGAASDADLESGSGCLRDEIVQGVLLPKSEENFSGVYQRTLPCSPASGASRTVNRPPSHIL